MDTIEILQKCTVEDNVVKLPNIQLDHHLEYVPIKRKLELIGGKWKSGKVKGFVFEQDPTELLAALQKGQDINIKKEYQFFATPTPLANYLVAIAEESVDFSKNPKILEPSAGDGALVKAIVKHFPDQRVDCIELMELNRIKLQQVVGTNILGNDFFCVHSECVGQYDLVIANPPFSNNQDIDHIKAMYHCLNTEGTLVSIASKSSVNGSQKKQIDFREWLAEVNAHTEEIPAGSFKESGTMVGAMLISIIKTSPDKKEVQTQEQPKENPVVFDNKKTEQSSTEAITHLQSLTNKNEEMDFFKQLSEVMGQSEMTIAIKQKEESITVMLLPKGLSGVRNLTLTGTAEELDEGFFREISGPISKAVGLTSNAKEFEADLETKTGTASAPKKSKPAAKKESEEKSTPASSEEISQSTEVKPEATTYEELVKKLGIVSPEEISSLDTILETGNNLGLTANELTIASAKREELASAKAEEERVDNLNALIKTAEEEIAKNNFRIAAKAYKDAKAFHLAPEELDEKIKDMLAKAAEQDFDNL